jgi:CheY-like chemotaxis protein
VDDEDDVRRVLGEHFTRAGFEVVEAEDPDTAVKKAGTLAREHRRFLLVTDLRMPTSGGTSFQGGFEVVKRLAKMNLRPPVLMMTETLNAATQTRARQMGVRSFVFKPGLSKLDPEQFDADLRAFAHKIVSDVLPRLERAAAAPVAPPPPPAPPGAPAAGAPAADALTREFAALQKWMHELRKPQDPTQISQLVVRVAREFFERGVLFVVKNEEIRGITGFGPAPEGESLHLLARAMAIPLAQPSPFENVVASQKPFTGILAANPWTDDFYERVGRFKAGEAALLPLLTNRETIALLYGDNAETGRPLRRMDGLEVFINQAGIALENAFLQRKVHALQGQE